MDNALSYQLLRASQGGSRGWFAAYTRAINHCLGGQNLLVADLFYQPIAFLDDAPRARIANRITDFNRGRDGLCMDAFPLSEILLITQVEWIRSGGLNRRNTRR